MNHRWKHLRSWMYRTSGGAANWHQRTWVFSGNKDDCRWYQHSPSIWRHCPERCLDTYKFQPVKRVLFSKFDYNQGWYDLVLFNINQHFLGFANIQWFLSHQSTKSSILCRWSESSWSVIFPVNALSSAYLSIIQMIQLSYDAYSNVTVTAQCLFIYRRFTCTRRSIAVLS